MLTLLLKNVRLETGYLYEKDFVSATETEIVDILIKDGEFKEIAPQIKIDNVEIVEANKQLLVPSLREMHIHIDKTYFGGEWKTPIKATEGIFTRIKEEETLLPKQLEQAEDKARKMVQHYISNGHTHIRTHVNVDPVIKAKHMKIVTRVLESFQDQITYEIVAFPQHGLLRNGPDFLKTFKEALQMGATHIGGVDPASVDRDSQKVIQKTFELAEKYDLKIDIHLHERNTLGQFDIEQILNEIKERSFANNVTLSHVFALAGLKGNSLDQLLGQMVANNIDVTTTVPIGEGPITIPVKYIDDHGIKVSLGHDSLVDHWSPFGSGDTIHKLNQFIQRFNYIDEFNISQSLKYATGGITPLDRKGRRQWPKVGQSANALIVDAVSSAHLIARQCPISNVISKGNFIHQEKIELKGELR